MFSNQDNIIDSRDVIDRIEELESERQDIVDERDEAREGLEDARAELAEAETDEERAEAKEAINEASDEIGRMAEKLAEWDDSEDAEELAALKSLADECEGYAPDWKHGEALIADEYFEEYAQELAEDIGAIQRDLSWPHDCIDWKQAADALKMDYTQVDFDGAAYWIR